jgi:DNA-binding transcriptional MerR regulator
VTGRWTLDELVAEVAARLGEGGVEQGSNRVRDVPDRRTVRYYTTLGLVDGPDERSGKVGLYGERQLLQLLAIKQLQARGETLATIQARLLGLSTGRLRAIAEASTSASANTSASASGGARAAPPPRGALLQGVPVSDSVILMLQLSRELTGEDLEAIEAASAPLLRLLRARHLIRLATRVQEQAP